MPLVFQSLEDLLPAVSEEGVLDFVNDENFLMLVIHGGAAGSDQFCGLTLNHRFGRDVTVIGHIPNSNKRFTDVSRNLHTGCLDGGDQFFALGYYRKTFRRINTGARPRDNRTRSDIAVIGSVEY